MLTPLVILTSIKVSIILVIGQWLIMAVLNQCFYLTCVHVMTLRHYGVSSIIVSMERKSIVSTEVKTLVLYVMCILPCHCLGLGWS